jgi:hypothetical protein
MGEKYKLGCKSIFKNKMCQISSPFSEEIYKLYYQWHKMKFKIFIELSHPSSCSKNCFRQNKRIPCAQGQRVCEVDLNKIAQSTKHEATPLAAKIPQMKR